MRNLLKKPLAWPRYGLRSQFPCLRIALVSPFSYLYSHVYTSYTAPALRFVTRICYPIKSVKSFSRNMRRRQALIYGTT